MSDPYWEDLDRALPRVRRGEPGWAHQREQVLARLHADARAPRRLAGLLAAGAVAAALAFVLRTKPAVPLPAPPSASMPSDDLDFLETTPLLEHLDEIMDAPELDHA